MPLLVLHVQHKMPATGTARPPGSLPAHAPARRSLESSTPKSTGSAVDESFAPEFQQRLGRAHPARFPRPPELSGVTHFSSFREASPANTDLDRARQSDSAYDARHHLRCHRNRDLLGRNRADLQTHWRVDAFHALRARSSPAALNETSYIIIVTRRAPRDMRVLRWPVGTEGAYVSMIAASAVLIIRAAWRRHRAPAHGTRPRANGSGDRRDFARGDRGFGGSGDDCRAS